jgi:hypothetical protein
MADSVACAEAAARSELTEEAAAVTTALECREREAGHTVHGRLYRKQLERQRLALTYDEEAQRRLDGYCGMWRKSYRAFLSARLAKKARWRESQEEEEKRRMCWEDESARGTARFRDACELLLRHYADRWLLVLADRQRSLDVIAAAEEAGRLTVEEELRGERRAHRARLEYCESLETDARCSWAFVERTDRDSFERVYDKASHDVRDRLRIIGQLVKRVIGREAAERRHVVDDEGETWFDTLLTEHRTGAEAAIAAQEATARVQLEDLYAHAKRVMKQRDDLMRKLTDISAEQSRVRSAIHWTENVNRQDIVRAQAALPPAKAST